MSINKVALIGATGNLGPAILKALLDSGYEVMILSREGSTSTDSLASHPGQKIAKVNFEDVNSITSAFHTLLLQKKIINAAVTANVKRFLPSDFGRDLSVEANKTVPFNILKLEIHQYLVEESKTYPRFSYTFICNGPFFDWCSNLGLFSNLATYDITLQDGGETKVSTTTLTLVGKAVVGVFKDLEATKNKEIRVADTTITQKQIIKIVKEIDGKEWTTKIGSARLKRTRLAWTR